MKYPWLAFLNIALGCTNSSLQMLQGKFWIGLYFVFFTGFFVFLYCEKIMHHWTRHQRPPALP